MTITIRVTRARIALTIGMALALLSTGVGATAHAPDQKVYNCSRVSVTFATNPGPETVRLQLSGKWYGNAPELTGEYSDLRGKGLGKVAVALVGCETR